MLTTLVPGGRAVRFAAAIVATLALGACAKDQNADASGFGAGLPMCRSGPSNNSNGGR